MEKGSSYREIVRQGNFVRFWLSIITAELGYGLFELAIVWLAITGTHSSFFTGIILFVEFATYSLTFAVAPIIDASPEKKRFVTWIFPVQAVLAIGLTVAVIAHAVSIPLILFVVFLMALLWDFPWLATSVILPLILKKEQLLRANSLMQAVGGGSSVMINAMGGVLLALVGVGGASAVYAVSFIIATLLMLTVKVEKVPAVTSTGRTATRGLVEGWKALISGGRKDLRSFFLLSGVQGFFAIAPMLLIAVIAAFHLKGGNGPLNFGLMLGTFLAGGFAGNFVYGRINPTRQIGKSMLIATLLEGVLIAVSPLLLGSLSLLYILWFLVGCFDPIFYTGYNTYIQATVDNDMIARMKGNIYMLRGIGRGTGNLALGALIALYGYGSGALFFGVALVMIALVVAATSQSVRNAGYN